MKDYNGWYQCPECGADILFAISPCPACGCNLNWSSNTPIIDSYHSSASAMDIQNNSFRKQLSIRQIIIIFLVIAVIITAFSFIPANNSDTENTDISYRYEVPATISEDEACAIVYRYLQSKVNSMPKAASWEFQDILNNATPLFTGTYLDNGKWEIWALGYYPNEKGEWVYYYKLGRWYVFEKSETVQPANDLANNLLQKWQEY